MSENAASAPEAPGSYSSQHMRCIAHMHAVETVDDDGWVDILGSGAIKKKVCRAPHRHSSSSLCMQPCTQ